MAAAARYGANGGFSVYLRPANARYGATMSVRYGRGHGQEIVKPFIVVEQYNIASVVPSLVECNNKKNDIGLFDDKIQSVRLQSGVTFNETLEAAGYDLVYIDFEIGLTHSSPPVLE